jgi:hypothetical protein
LASGSSCSSSCERPAFLREGWLPGARRAPRIRRPRPTRGRSGVGALGPLGLALRRTRLRPGWGRYTPDDRPRCRLQSASREEGMTYGRFRGRCSWIAWIKRSRRRMPGGRSPASRFQDWPAEGNRSKANTASHSGDLYMDALPMPPQTTLQKAADIEQRHACGDPRGTRLSAGAHGNPVGSATPSKSG